MGMIYHPFILHNKEGYQIDLFIPFRYQQGGLILMKKHLLTLGVLSALVLTSSNIARADSYGGSDWIFNLSGTLFAPLVGATAVTSNNLAITIGQTSMTDITIPMNIPPYLSQDVPMTVSGTSVTGQILVASITLPAGTISGVNVPLVLEDIRINLAGTATGIAGHSQAFGPRVYDITGTPSNSPFDTDPNTTWATIDRVMFGGVVNIGAAHVEVASWSAVRPVPEPASMLALGAGLLGLAARRRKK